MTLTEPMSPLRRALVLRVLEGPGRGAELPFDETAQLSIGGALEGDVVLRGAEARAARVVLAIHGGVARLKVDGGEVKLLGQAIPAPGELILPAFVPFMIGEVSLAYGEVGSSRWRDAERLAGLQLLPDADIEPAQAPLAQGLRSAVAKIELLAPVFGFVMAGALLGWAIGAQIESRLAPAPPTIGQWRHRLAAAGFPGLSVRPVSGGAEVDGVVPDSAAVARLERWARDRTQAPQIRVRTDGEVEAEIGAAFTHDGLAGNVRPEGPGAYRFDLTAGDETRAQATGARIRSRDPAVRRLDVVPEGAQAAAAAEGGPTMRIVAAATGPDGYVTTADGHRYFVGAVLPSGGRLTAIEDHRLVVEGGGAPFINY